MQIIRTIARLGYRTALNVAALTTAQTMTTLTVAALTTAQTMTTLTVAALAVAVGLNFTRTAEGCSLVPDIAAAVIAQQPPAAEIERPLTMADLIALAEDGVSGADILSEIELRKIDFVPDDAAVSALLKAGIEPHIVHRMSLFSTPLQTDLTALVSQYKEQRFERIIESATLVLKRAPRCLVALRLRGDAYLQTRAWSSAITDLQQLYRLDPGYQPRYDFMREFAAPAVLLSRALRMSGKAREAIAFINDDLRQHADMATAALFLERAVAHATVGDGASARGDALLAIQRSPLSAELYLFTAELLVSSPDPAVRNPAAAEWMAQATLQLTDPLQAADAWSMLAAAHAASGSFDAAIENQNRAIALAPAAKVSAMKLRLDDYKAGKPAFANVDTTTTQQTAATDIPAEIRKRMRKIPVVAATEDDGKSGRLPPPSAEFLLSDHEVTHSEWSTIMGESIRGPVGVPVDRVSWEQCESFITRLNAASENIRYRLPTESEWETAARCGKKGEFSFGDDPKLLADFAWFADNAGDVPHAVSQRKPNDYQLYDMYGNVSEWCSNTPGNAAAANNPLRVFRGGNYRSPGERSGTSARGLAPLKERRAGLGFRLAADVPAETAKSDAVKSDPASKTAVKAAETAAAAARDAAAKTAAENDASHKSKAHADGAAIFDELISALQNDVDQSITPPAREIANRRLAFLYLVRGYTAIAAHRPKLAAESFQQAQSQSSVPQDATSWLPRCLLSWVQSTAEDGPDAAAVRNPVVAENTAETVMGLTQFKHWLPYAVLAAAHAEQGAWDKAITRARQALDQAPDEFKAACRSRLTNYEQRRTSRSEPPPWPLYKGFPQ